MGLLTGELKGDNVKILSLSYTVTKTESDISQCQFFVFTCISNNSDPLKILL